MVAGATSNLPAKMKNILVIGASGNVGQGVCLALLAAGHRVIASSRSAQKLAALKNMLAACGRIEMLTGSVASDAEANELCRGAIRLAGTLDAVVTSINTPIDIKPLLQFGTDEFAEQLRGNLVVHFTAARTFIPAIANGGTYLAIGGGMADIVVPTYGIASTVQGGLRNMLRMIAREGRGGPVNIRELLLCSFITPLPDGDKEHPDWLTGGECGRHALAVIEEPARFPGPILALRSKHQVGQPEQ